MFKLQMRRGFALPEYSFENEYVKLIIGGTPVHKPIPWETLEKADLSDTIYELAAEYQKSLDSSKNGPTPENGEKNNMDYPITTPKTEENYPVKPFEAKRTTPKNTSEKILALIKANPCITRDEMAEECGISVDGIKWQIKQLKGKIEFVGPRKGGHWQILSDTIDGAGDK